MNRRGFLQSLLGIGAAAALPPQALALLERTKALPDAEFQRVAASDDAIIDLISARIRIAQAVMLRHIEESLYSEGTEGGEYLAALLPGDKQ